MKLILDLFEKIFKALSGVYTKEESDAALTAEATARQEADEALSERIDTNAESAADELAKMRRVINEIGEVIWFTLTIPEDDGTHDRWVTDDGTHERDNNPPTYARYYDAQAWKLTTTDGGTATIDWGDGTVESFASVTSFELCHKYTVAGTYELTARGGVKSFALATTNGYLSIKEVINRMLDMSPVFNAATIKGASISGAMQGATGARTCFYVSPNAYSAGFTGMKNSPDSTIYAAINGNNSMILHMHMFGKAYVSAVGATTRISLFSEGNATQYSVFAPDLKDLAWTYLTNSYVPPVVSYYAPNVVNANGKSYYAFMGATKLKTLLYGFPSVQKARDAFKNTNLDAASVVRILKALPDLSADTEHLPDLSITNFDDAYYGYRIVTFTTTVSTAAVKNPTAEMWEAYDEAVAKGWLVEGFEGTHP